MKIILLLVASVIGSCFADQCVDIPSDMNGQQDQSTVTYEDFLHQTFNSTDPQCNNNLPCCPKIVTFPTKVGSVIQPFSGYRGNAAIIVDWGNSPSSCNPYRRRCTLQDSPFVWYINWGDGTSDHDYQKTLGPFQKAHQYPKYCKQYGVTVYYCNLSNSCRQRKCCDSIYRVIDVSYDPQHPYPDVKYEQF